MRVLIADDEPLARQRLRQQLEQLSREGLPYRLVSEVGDGLSAVAAATAERPDVALLDIQMPGLDGIRAALEMAVLEFPPALIFVTAYDDHALQAFDAHAIDYLLKPVRTERLAAALERARLLNAAQREALSMDPHALSVTYRGRLLRIPLGEVIFLRAEQKYVEVCYQGGEALFDGSLKSLEQQYPGRFLRIHRNALVARGFVRELCRDADGQVTLGLLGSEQRLLVSRRHLPAVRRLLKG